MLYPLILVFEIFKETDGRKIHPKQTIYIYEPSYYKNNRIWWNFYDLWGTCDINCFFFLYTGLFIVTCLVQEDWEIQKLQHLQNFVFFELYYYYLSLLIILG